MKLYSFETLNDFGYCRDPHTVYTEALSQVSKLDHYTITDGKKDVHKRKFKYYGSWQGYLNRDGEVYFEVYGGKAGEPERFQGIIKIEEFVTKD